MFRPSKELCKCGKEKSQVAKTCFECRKKRVERICKTCNSKYTTKQSTNKVYCSRKCRYADTEANKAMHANQSKREQYECKQCTKYCDVQKSKSRGGFCSLKCFYQYNRGQNNPLWKGGVTPERQSFYKSDEWKSAVKIVWERDNATCQRCGCRNEADIRHEFHIHHVISFKHKEFRADVDNLLLVCKNCHIWIHSSQNKLKEYIVSVQNND